MSTATLTLPDLNIDLGGTPQGPIRLGSDAHKNLFCRTLLTTFNPYKPAIIDWPTLDEDTRKLIINLPIWNMAVQAEGKAGIRVATFGELVTDPVLRKAIELDAYEEKRHKLVLANLVEAYGIQLAPEPKYPKPRDPEWAFMVTGYSECIDSFFAFGLFEAAKRTGLFPPELVATFEPVMQEEGRHILFFVNWIAWYRRNMAWWRRPYFALKVMAVWVFLVWERLGIVKDMSGGAPQDNNFTLNGAKEIGTDLDLISVVDICLKENDRRLGIYDKRLLRPNFVPNMVRLVRRLIPRPVAET